MQIEITGTLEHQLTEQANLAGVDIHSHALQLLEQSVEMMATNDFPRRCKRCAIQHFETQGVFHICQFCGLYHYSLGDGSKDRPIRWYAVTPAAPWLNPDHAALAQSDPNQLVNLAEAFNAQKHQEKAEASRLRIFGPKHPSPQTQ